MEFKRILGLDLGEKTIGVAVSDPLGLTAQALKTIRRGKIERDLKELSELIEELNVSEIVIGLPMNMNHTEGPMAEKAREFGKLLEETFQLPIVFQDERLSSVSAEQVLIEGNIRRENRKYYIDKIAASLILQTYLDLK